MRTAVLHVLSLSHYAVVQVRGRAVGNASMIQRVRVENDRLREEVLQLREEIRIKDARMALIAAHQRPRYRPVERLAILELRAARGWSLEQTARAFLVTAATISTWLRRLEEEGPDALVKLPQPANKFPELVGYLVHRLKTLCPALGKRKIAQVLARAGLHLGANTVARMLREEPSPPPTAPPPRLAKPRVVAAQRPNQVWHVDLTAVPIVSGFWCAWSPCALPQYWPFCWWMAVVVDHYSRRVMGAAVFGRQPTSEAVRAFLGRTAAKARAAPKYLICDRGTQFDCDGFRRWCRRHTIRPRYGALGKHGSIAVVERFIRTLKELLGLLALVPMRREAFRHELNFIVDWYNEHRPHETLGGRTPNEDYLRRFPAHRRPRFEPRSKWPRGSPCAKPWALVRGKLGARLQLNVEFLAGHKHLPIITLRRAA